MISQRNTVHFKDSYKSNKPSGGSIKIFLPPISTLTTIDVSHRDQDVRGPASSATTNQLNAAGSHHFANIAQRADRL